MNQTSTRRWAEEEFGTAKLGDVRRVRRLVQVADAALKRPAGQVTKVFDELAAREGTFRLLENEDVDAAAIGVAAHRACADRLKDESYAFVAVDQTSLNITDREGVKGLGLIGARSMGVTGLEVMTALAVSPQGVPQGICGQRYWTRVKAASKKQPLRQRETGAWLAVIEQARAALAKAAPQTQPWFQLDRGADAWPILLDGLLSTDRFTIRAAQDRRVGDDGPRRYLWETVEAAPCLGTKELAAPRGKRSHELELRACELTLKFTINNWEKLESPPLFALLVRERGKGADAIEWLLLTNHPIHTLADAELVLFGYAQRWRIEQFHRLWKTGACNVEDSQLQDVEHLIRWATILASVAVRLLRLIYLARHAPSTPAVAVLSRAEIDAAILRSRTRKHRPGADLTMDEAVLLIAQIGGYTGRKSSGGPPGAIVMARGLYTIESLAFAISDGLVSINP